MDPRQQRCVMAVVSLVCLVAPVLAAAVDRNVLRVEFLYAVESAGGRATKLLEPTDIFVDHKTGELYVTDAASHKVFVYDQNGMFLQGADVAGKQGAPKAVAVDGEGRWLVSHMTSAKLSLFDFRGTPLDVLRLPGTTDVPGNTVRPMALATGPDGAVYVLKTAGGIVKVDPAGESHQEISLAGAVLPNVMYGMAVDPRGRFLFTDMRPYSVVIFDPQTRESKRFGSAGVLYGQLDRPIGITTDDAGHIFVVSTVTNKVSCFDAEGRFLEEFGQPGERYGQFYMPTRIASDGKNRIYVLENTAKRVQVFRLEFLQEKEVAQGAADASAADRESSDGSS